MNLNQIYNEDNISTMSKMSNDFLDLTITSPPYNLGQNHHTGNKTFKSYDVYSDDLDENIYQKNQISFLNELYRVTKNGGSLIYNHKNRIRNGISISPYEWLLKSKWNIKQEIIWFNGSQNFDKIRFYPMTEKIFWLSKGIKTDFINNINSNDIFNDKAVGTKKYHKRSFPLSLVRKFIICFPNAEIIYDPYIGSGTTAIASLKENRNFIGSEISENYYNYSKKRIKEHQSQIRMF